VKVIIPKFPLKETSYTRRSSYSSRFPKVKKYLLSDVLPDNRIAIRYTRGAIILAMKFRALQENLRKALWERIEEGELTGLRLARETGFK
jgi:hypothetical protein